MEKIRYAIIGKSGSGKSEAGRILSVHYKCQVAKTGAICRAVSQLLFGNEDKRSTQRLDDALTPLDGSIFLRAALRQIDLEQPFVIDSLRFDSDLRIAQELACTTIRIVCDDEARLHRLRSRGQSFNSNSDGKHRSEVELDAAATSYVVDNCGSLRDLEYNLLKAISTPK